MFRKSFISSFFLGALLIFGHAAVFAQTAPVSGKVELDKGNGVSEPVAGALVEVFRTDIKTGLPSTKTNKKGEFNFAGFMLGGVYALSVSAPGCAPEIYPGIKAGQEKLVIKMNPGDGKKWTEAEVRKAVTDGASAKSDGGTTEPSAEQKKAQDEYNKKVEENNAARKKAENTNKTVNTVLKEGAAAFDAKNYDLAVAKFDEGYQADPDFEGSAPVLLTNKGQALRERGIFTTKQAATGTEADKAAAFQKAKEDFAQAIVAFDRAIEILEKAPAGDAAAQSKLAISKTDALKQYVITHGVMAKLRLDPAKSEEAVPVLDRYIAAETDDAKKTPVLMTWANYMRESGNTKSALHAYRIILGKSPDNVDAMAGMGLSLFAEGVGTDPQNKEQMQEGLNLMQKFADTAPDTHPLKASVKESVDYLKNTAKLAPQKVVTPAKRKN